MFVLFLQSTTLKYHEVQSSNCKTTITYNSKLWTLSRKLFPDCKTTILETALLKRL